MNWGLLTLSVWAVIGLCVVCLNLVAHLRPGRLAGLDELVSRIARREGWRWFPSSPGCSWAGTSSSADAADQR